MIFLFTIIINKILYSMSSALALFSPIWLSETNKSVRDQEESNRRFNMPPDVFELFFTNKAIIWP